MALPRQRRMSQIKCFSAPSFRSFLPPLLSFDDEKPVVEEELIGLFFFAYRHAAPPKQRRRRLAHFLSSLFFPLFGPITRALRSWPDSKGHRTCPRFPFFFLFFFPPSDGGALVWRENRSSGSRPADLSSPPLFFSLLDGPACLFIELQKRKKERRSSFPFFPFFFSAGAITGVTVLAGDGKEGGGIERWGDPSLPFFFPLFLRAFLRGADRPFF